MSHNYERPHIDPHWADSRNTYPVVAATTHAIADISCRAEAIWKDIKHKIRTLEAETLAKPSTKQ